MVKEIDGIPLSEGEKKTEASLRSKYCYSDEKIIKMIRLNREAEVDKAVMTPLKKIDLEIAGRKVVKTSTSREELDEANDYRPGGNYDD